MTGTYVTENPIDDVYDVTSLGASLKRTSATVIELTKEEAANFLEKFPAFENVDRQLRDSHVRYLTKTMIRGQFNSSWVRLAVCTCREKYAGKPAGTVWRVNGQHTAWARRQMPDDYRCAVTMERWAAKTVDDMRQLYASIDRLAPRTKSNVIQSWVGGSPEFVDVPRSRIKVLAAALQYYLWDTPHERTAHDGDEVAYLMRTDHYDICAKLSRFLADYPNNREHRHVWRAPVCGAMLATMAKAPVVAAERFWSSVTTGTAIDKKNDPRLKLRNALITACIQSGGGSRTGRSMVSGEQMFRWCLSCWNAFREGRELHTIRNPNERPRVK